MKTFIKSKKLLLIVGALLLFFKLSAQTVTDYGYWGDHPDVHAHFGCAVSNGILGWYFDILPWDYLNPALDQATIVYAEIGYMYWDGVSEYDILGIVFEHGPILDEVMNSGSFDLSAVLGDLSQLEYPINIWATLYFDDGTYMNWSCDIVN